LSIPEESWSEGLQLQSCITADGELALALRPVATPAPAADEVVIRVEAAPINPSDIGLLFGAADLATLTVEPGRVHARVPQAAMKGMAGRVGQWLAVGNEGAGTVIRAGEEPAAQALIGRKVAVLAGAMYSQYRTVKASECLSLPPGASAADGASAIVNPMTVLGMVETMRREGHTALVHTAAASNLGQMLNRLCRAEGVGLVSIVRRPEQVALLRSQAAEHVLSTESPDFDDQLTHAVQATGATLAFDATGGGRLAGRILTAMEAALARGAAPYSRYGSTTHKQVYIYGGLDGGPTEFERSFGMHWGMGGWLMSGFLQRVGIDGVRAARERVAAELHTTFASPYSGVISLAEALSAEAIAAYGRRATASKLLIDPSR
jgi:NADPH2:quinone reductase